MIVRTHVLPCASGGSAPLHTYSFAAAFSFCPVGAVAGLSRDEPYPSDRAMPLTPCMGMSNATATAGRVMAGHRIRYRYNIDHDA
jgi:hypothetical protein